MTWSARAPSGNFARLNRRSVGCALFPRADVKARDRVWRDMRTVSLLLVLSACAGEFTFDAPTVEGLRQVVPGDGMPPEVQPKRA